MIAGGQPQEPEVGRRPRGSGAEQVAHQEPEIVSGDVDQVTLGDVVAPAQPGPPHATPVEHVRERPLAQHRPQQERDPGHAREQPGAIGVDRPPGVIVAAPVRRAGSAIRVVQGLVARRLSTSRAW